MTPVGPLYVNSSRIYMSDLSVTLTFELQSYLSVTSVVFDVNYKMTRVGLFHFNSFWTHLVALEWPWTLMVSHKNLIICRIGHDNLMKISLKPVKQILFNRQTFGCLGLRPAGFLYYSLLDLLCTLCSLWNEIHFWSFYGKKKVVNSVVKIAAFDINKNLSNFTLFSSSGQT